VDRLPELPRLQLHLHEEAPFVVVALGEHQPRRASPGVAVDSLLHRRSPATSSAPLW
jgi:hypothetical protein